MNKGCYLNNIRIVFFTNSSLQIRNKRMAKNCAQSSMLRIINRFFARNSIHFQIMFSSFKRYKFEDDDQAENLAAEVDHASSPSAGDSCKDKPKTPAQVINLSPSRVELKKFRFKFFNRGAVEFRATKS
jgi:hypothetical protein